MGEEAIPIHAIPPRAIRIARAAKRVATLRDEPPLKGRGRDDKESETRGVCTQCCDDLKHRGYEVRNA